MASHNNRETPMKIVWANAVFTPRENSALAYFIERKLLEQFSLFAKSVPGSSGVEIATAHVKCTFLEPYAEK